MFPIHSYLDLLGYIVLMLVLWIIVRYALTNLSDVLQFFRTSDKPIIVNPFNNDVQYPVSYWSERGGMSYFIVRYLFYVIFGFLLIRPPISRR
jgi:hypothetical protein